MMPAMHWSQIYSCICGKTFRSYAADAVHRHNFPALCRAQKPKRGKPAAAPHPTSPKKEVHHG